LKSEAEGMRRGFTAHRGEKTRQKERRKKPGRKKKKHRQKERKGSFNPVRRESRKPWRAKARGRVVMSKLGMCRAKSGMIGETRAGLK